MELPGDDLDDHRAFLYRLALDLVADEDHAEDLVQQVLLYSLQRPPRSGRARRSWLRKVLRHKAIDSIVTDRRRRDREALSASGVERHDPPASDSERRAIVWSAIQELDADYRDVIILHYWHERGTREISRELGIPAGTVKTRLIRGRELLRQRLARTHRGEPSLGVVLFLIPLLRSSRPTGSGTIIVATATISIVFLLSLAWFARTPGPVDSAAPAELALRETRSPRGLARPPQLSARTPDDLLADPLTADPESGTEPRVTYRVVDPSGIPVAGARVGLFASGQAPDAATAPDESNRTGPLLTSVTNARGEGVLHLPIPRGELHALDPESYTVGAGLVSVRQTALTAEVVIAATCRLEGTALDLSRNPSEGVRVTVMPAIRAPLPVDLCSPSTRLCQLQSATTDARGRFSLQAPQLDGLLLRFLFPDGNRELHRVTEFHPTATYQLVSRREEQDPLLTSGFVVDADGHPLPGARVGLKESQGLTDEEGRFLLRSSRRPFHATPPEVHAFAEGVGVGASPLPASPGEPVRVAIDRGYGDIRGRVLDADRAPVPGAEVWFGNPSYSSITGRSIEELLKKGPGGDRILTDEEGWFTIAGIADRPYRVRARDSLTGAEGETECQVGDAPPALLLARPVLADVSGSIVYADGTGAEHLEIVVAVVESTLANRMGTVDRELRVLSRTKTDESGEFSLEQVPTRGTIVRAWGEGVIPVEVPVDLVEAGPVVIQRGAMVSVVPDLGKPHFVRFFSGMSPREPLPVIHPAGRGGWNDSSSTLLRTTARESTAFVSSEACLAVHYELVSGHEVEVGRTLIDLVPGFTPHVIDLTNLDPAIASDGAVAPPDTD